MWFIGVEAEQETSAPRPKKNPGSAPVLQLNQTSIHRAWFKQAFKALNLSAKNGSIQGALQTAKGRIHQLVEHLLVYIVAP